MFRFRTAFLALAAMAFAGHASARLMHYTSSDAEDLNRVSAYLNSIRTMSGSFVQIGPDGQIDQGKFVLSKPGRMRFEYGPPTPTLIVSDGSTVAVENTKLKTQDRYPLGDTPLYLILSDKIDLLHNNDTVGVDREQDALIVKAQYNTSQLRASITLTFSQPELELRQWTVVDSQGQSTTVALRNVQTGTPVNAAQFVVPDRNPFTHRIRE